MQTLIAHVAIQVALVTLYRSFGIEPSAVIGHSSGEMLAAWSVGVASTESLCRVVYARAMGQHKTAPGAMASFGVNEAQCLATFKELRIDDLDIAAINSVDNVTIAGPQESIEKVGLYAKPKKLLFIILPIVRAYHSRYTESIKDEFFKALEDFVPSEPRAGQTFFSTVTCKKMTGIPLDVAYWWSNVRGTVQFAKGLSVLLPETDVLLEIGPHAVLSSFINSQIQGTHHLALTSLKRSRSPAVDDVNELLISLANLHCRGVSVNWSNVQSLPLQSLQSPDLQLPPMLWKHASYRHGRFKLHSPPSHQSQPATTTSSSPLKTETPTSQAATVGVFDPFRDAYIRDHVVNGVVALPGAAFVTTGLQLAVRSGLKSNAVIDIRFERFCEWIKEKDPLTLNTLFDGRNYSFEQGGVTLSRGSVVERPFPLPIDSSSGILSMWERVTSSAKKLNMARVYPALATHSGIAFGPTFRRLAEVYKVDTELVALVSPFRGPEAPPGEKGLNIPIHPTLLDAAFQLLGIGMGLHTEACVPRRVSSVIIKDSNASIGIESSRLHLRITSASSTEWTADADFYNSSDQLILAVRGAVMAPVKSMAPSDLTIMSTTLLPLTLKDTTISDETKSKVSSSKSASDSVNVILRGLSPNQTLTALFSNDVNIDSTITLVPFPPYGQWPSQ